MMTFAGHGSAFFQKLGNYKHTSHQVYLGDEYVSYIVMEILQLGGMTIYEAEKLMRAKSFFHSYTLIRPRYIDSHDSKEYTKKLGKFSQVNTSIK